MGKKKIVILLVITVCFLITIAVALLFYTGVFQINHVSSEEYPVRGVDVSEYQGQIDWQLLQKQDISFAFIKATEGSSYIDPQFANNWKDAAKTNLKIGAYHFFSFESESATQAENFISAVPVLQGGLPPVVDVEFYGKFINAPPEAQAVVAELRTMLTLLEEHYGVKPILYFTEKSYELYIKDNFADDYILWARSVYGTVKYMPENAWTFWQYSNRTKLSGYNGVEPYIDMNCFAGNEQEFLRFCLQYAT